MNASLPRARSSHFILAAMSVLSMSILLIPASRRTPLPASGRSKQPADAVLAAEAAVRLRPADPVARQRLAVALMQRQRQTGDASLQLQAEDHLRRALQHAQGDYTTRKLLAWVLASRHRFDEALVIARECAGANPHDDWNWGVIADCLTETGDYPGAVNAVQRMIDLKPGAHSYARAAHQRWLHGDPEGALELLDLALDATDPADREARAWLTTQKAEIHHAEGRLLPGLEAAERALRLSPGYHLALAARARLLASRGDLAASETAYRTALTRVERPDWRAALGDVLAARGMRVAAETEYAAAERYLTERLDDPSADATHMLAQILADRGRNRDLALALAVREASDARDIRACDTLARALYHAGRHRQAWIAARKALRLGTRDSKLLYHAGMIALNLPGQEKEGRRLLSRALALNPRWDPLDSAAARLALR